MDENEAMRAITINAATIVGAADRIGSLEPGKDADIAIFFRSSVLHSLRYVNGLMSMVYLLIAGKIP